MLTSYLVRCPHLGCGWFGSLIPRADVAGFAGAVPSVVRFVCPHCRRDWMARKVGDDVMPIRLEEPAAVRS